MFKKLAITAAAGALMLSAAAGAFAFTGNFAHSFTGVATVSNSGGNSVNGGGKNSDTNHNTVNSGNSTATTTVVTAQNTQLGGRHSHGTTVNSAHQGTLVLTGSNSGGNSVNGGDTNSDTNGNSVNSGDSSATTTVVTLQNTSVSGF